MREEKEKDICLHRRPRKATPVTRKEECSRHNLTDPRASITDGPFV